MQPSDTGQVIQVPHLEAAIDDLLAKLTIDGLNTLPAAVYVARLVTRRRQATVELIEALDRLEPILGDEPSAWHRTGAGWAISAAHDAATAAAEAAADAAVTALDRRLAELHALARSAGRGRSTAARQVGALRSCLRYSFSDPALILRLQQATEALLTEVRAGAAGGHEPGTRLAEETRQAFGALFDLVMTGLRSNRDQGQETPYATYRDSDLAVGRHP